jgi:hypothetical protein
VTDAQPDLPPMTRDAAERSLRGMRLALDAGEQCLNATVILARDEPLLTLYWHFTDDGPGKTAVPELLGRLCRAFDGDTLVNCVDSWQVSMPTAPADPDDPLDGVAPSDHPERFEVLMGNIYTANGVDLTTAYWAYDRDAAGLPVWRTDAPEWNTLKQETGRVHDAFRRGLRPKAARPDPRAVLANLTRWTGGLAIGAHDRSVAERLDALGLAFNAQWN